MQHWFGGHGLKVSMTYMSWYSDFCRHGPVILFYIWNPNWHMNIISPDFEMVWHNNSPQYSMTYMMSTCHGSVISVFMVQWFCPISESPFDIWTSYLQTMKCYDTVFDLNINIGHFGLYFMVQWFCFISERSFDICTSYFQIMKWYDTTFDLNMIVSHCDLYFMVQWFC